MSAGRHLKAHPNARITEAGTKRTSTSVKESRQQRNQDQDYGSDGKKDEYFRKREQPVEKPSQGLRKWEQKGRVLP